MLEVEIQACPRDLHRDQGIDDDDASVAFEDRHVGEVEPADLVDAVRDLEEAVVHVQSRLPPQARVHGGRRLHFVEKRVVLETPDDPAQRVLDLDRREGREKATPRVLEVLRVLERECVEQRAVLRARDGRRVVGAVGCRSHAEASPGVTDALGRTRKTSGEIFTLSERLPPPRMIQGRPIRPSST